MIDPAQVVGHVVDALLTQTIGELEHHLVALLLVTGFVAVAKLRREVVAGGESLVEGLLVFVLDILMSEGLAQALLTGRRVGHVDTVVTHALGKRQRLGLFVRRCGVPAATLRAAASAQNQHGCGRGRPERSSQRAGTRPSHLPRCRGCHVVLLRSWLYSESTVAPAKVQVVALLGYFEIPLSGYVARLGGAYAGGVNGVSRIGQGMSAVRSHPFVMDVALVTVLCAVALIDNVVNAGHHGGIAIGVVVPVVVIAYGAVLFRRRWPIAALAVTVVATTVLMTVSRAYGWVVIAPLITLYHLAATTSDRRRSLVTGGLAALALTGISTFAGRASWFDGPWLNGGNLAIAAACGLALAAGDATRNRRAYVAEVEQRARRAEHSREQEAQRRVTEERVRIARDLHDSMGHHIALINAQAGMAAHVFADQPDTARQALAHIRHASREALDELRDTVGLLRQPGEPATPTEPTAGVSGLEDLVASLRGSGMRIDHEVDGSVRPLPPAADLTAYRVVQEALTNVGKHSAGAAARVQLSFQPEALHIVVEDEGNGQPAPPADPSPDAAGHGIVGMRERISALGGTLDTGSRPGGGFRVSAVLPLPKGVRP